MTENELAEALRAACRKSDIERSVTLALKLRDRIYIRSPNGDQWRLPDGSLSNSHETAILAWIMEA